LTYTSSARPKRKLSAALGLATAAALIALPSMAIAQDGEGSGGVGMGGEGTTPPTTGQTTVGPKAKLKDGFAIAPASAPNKVKRAIDAANQIVKGKPYCMGGGHGRRRDTCYDCSGSVSYALTGAGLLDASMPSGSFMNWEKGGKGAWITTYANEGHIYAVIAGLRLDTSMTTGDGPGWSKQMRSSSGYVARHPAGF
jgi:cell wall-associated NlpC family hydrolase